MFTEFVERIENVNKMSCKPSFPKLHEGHITDEDKSVKWNREQVIKNNEAYMEEVKRLNREKNTARDLLMREIYSAMQDELVVRLDTKALATIWHYAFEQGHSSSMREVFIHLEEMIDLANVILNGKKK